MWSIYGDLEFLMPRWGSEEPCAVSVNESCLFCTTFISGKTVANAVILEKLSSTRSWIICYFVVDRRYRRRAVGSRTVEFIKNTGRACGVQHIDACVLAENNAALNFGPEMVSLSDVIML